MTVFNPKYVKDGHAVAKAAQRIINYRKDIAKSDHLDLARSRLRDLKDALKARAQDRIDLSEKRLVEVLGRIDPPNERNSIREHVELVLVAVALALGIRAYYLQPFKIPTGSMQPTLNGVIAHRTEGPPPNVVARVAQFMVLGRTYGQVISQHDNDTILQISPAKLNLLWDGSAISMSSGETYRIGMEPRILQEQLGVGPGQIYQKGQPIVQAYAELGDQLFVDKFSYNFIGPHRADVFVFKTNGIVGTEQGPEGGGTHYIKRLAGVPGDTLRIDQPTLFINGREAEAFPFRRVASMQNGYTGYTNGGLLYLRTPDSTVTVGPRQYFALGDNSPNSSDSRYWGFVPAENVVGRGLFVYWPFTRHWGLVK